MADVFISYANEDEGFAQDVKRSLESSGVTVFLSQLSIGSGSIWIDRILDELSRCLCVFLLVSEKSCSSPYVQQEIGVAIGTKKPIVPIVRDDHTGTLPGLVARYQMLDFRTKAPSDINEHLAQLGKRIVARRKDLEDIRNSLTLSLLDKTIGFKQKDWLG